MATSHAAGLKASAQPDQIAAVRGARWYTVAFLAVGIFNYGYALLLTRSLDAAAYSRFSAGQGLILCASTVATVAVPWVLAQSLARARSSSERDDAIRFAIVISIGGGILAGTAVAAVASQFAGPATMLALAVSTLLIFLSTVTTGWLQGSERIRTLSTLTSSEAGLKSAVGLLLVATAGLGDTGALAAFGLAVLPSLFWWPSPSFWWPSPSRGSGRLRHSVTTNRDLWRRAVGIAGVQGLVAVMGAIDLVLVTVLPGDRSAAASYQASVVLARVPTFMASAISAAFLPSLSRRRAGESLAARALSMYVIVALPLTTVFVTAPRAVLSALFPAQYGMMATLLEFTAITGFAVGGLNLVTTFFQAVDDYTCLWWQAAGLLGYVAALLVGWSAAGVRGLAVGAACGAVGALVLLACRLVRRQGTGVLRRVPLLEPLVLAGLLTLLRPYLVLWLIVATATGLRAAQRFLHRSEALDASPPVHHGKATSQPATWQTAEAYGLTSSAPAADGADHVREEVHEGTHMNRAQGRRATETDMPKEPTRLLVDAVWRGDVRPASDAELQRVLALARRNQVEGRLARAYPQQLASTVAEVHDANELFRHNLCQVTDLLRAAGIPTVLIKADLMGDYVYSNFDLVVRDWQWKAACATLADWYVHESKYWLERSTKVLLEPPLGPAAHLHTAVSWFGVPVIPTGRLFDRAVAHSAHAWLLPDPVEQLRIWLAHGLFQNLALDLSELLAVRDLLRPDVVAEARREAAREGWAAGFGGALATATDAIGRLDRGLPIRLPVPLPVTVSLKVGAEHTLHLLHRGRARTAAREAALRLPLVVAKKRRMLVR
ncbi:MULTISPECIES: lipopolysaccharide biosynthesis protein [unclassified Streptomyces]|uniref:lipopolysaccharide biosynthesis protein n=1 Tax=unclassified Streptomyces TaxID=2593676 RepID=UPI003D8FA3D7